jgi:hypothetical protein
MHTTQPATALVPAKRQFSHPVTSWPHRYTQLVGMGEITHPHYLPTIKPPKPQTPIPQNGHMYIHTPTPHRPPFVQTHRPTDEHPSHAPTPRPGAVTTRRTTRPRGKAEPWTTRHRRHPHPHAVTPAPPSAPLGDTPSPRRTNPLMYKPTNVVRCGPTTDHSHKRVSR